MFYYSQYDFQIEKIKMSSLSWKTLLLEAVENQGYSKGYCDGRRANGRVQGRQQGIGIAKRQIAKALLSEGLTIATIAKVTGLSTATLEWLL